MKPPGHVTTHWIGGGLGIVVGIVGLALRKKTSTVGLAVSILAVVLALAFILDALGYPVSSMLQPHGLVMEAIGGLTAVVGIVGILAGLALKPKTTSKHCSAPFFFCRRCIWAEDLGLGKKCLYLDIPGGKTPRAKS